MDKELKSYLDEQFKVVDNRFNAVEQKIEIASTEHLEVMLDIKQNTTNGFERVEEQLENIENIIERHGARLDKLEDKVQILQTKLT